MKAKLFAIGRWRLDWESYSWYRSRRFRYSRGGQRTVGPWWQLALPYCGVLVLSVDRTLFGEPPEQDQ